jgi:proliferating cell nuclear antigen
MQVYAKTRGTQIKRWREILEALKDFLLSAVNLDFVPTGVQLLAMDASKTAMAHLFLKAEGFAEYQCSAMQTVGIKIADLLKAIKAMSTATDVTFKVVQSDKRHELVITGVDERKHTAIEFNLTSLETDSQRFRIPHTEWCRTIQIPTKDFKSYIATLFNTNAETMVIEWHDRILTLRAEEDTRQCKISIATTEKSIDDAPEDRKEKRSAPDEASDASSEQPAKRQRVAPSAELPSPVSPPFVAEDVPDFCERFELKYMQHFTKAEPLNAVVRILLRANFPLCLTYEIVEWGSLTFFLNPKIDEDDGDAIDAGEFEDFE